MSFGEGGFGDHSAKLWNWPLGEHGKVEVHSSDKTFEAWLDFRPFEPNEVWVMNDIVCSDFLMYAQKLHSSILGESDGRRAYDTLQIGQSSPR